MSPPSHVPTQAPVRTWRGIARAVLAALPGKALLYQALRCCFRLPPSVYRHLHFQGIFTTTVGGRRFRMHHFGYAIENAVFWEGIEKGFEPVSIGLWARSCEHARVILDVGANTGLFSLAAKAVNPAAQVIAFEPIDRVYQRLEQNCRLNDFDVRCEKLALSDRGGEAVVYDTLAEHTYSVTIGKNLHDAEVPVREIRIPTIRLEDYWARAGLGRIDLMKIDVETHEAEVLEGMGSLLARDRPALLVEVLNAEVGRNVERILGPLGYRFYSIDEASDASQEPGLTEKTFRNYFACLPEHAERLGLR